MKEENLELLEETLENEPGNFQIKHSSIILDNTTDEVLSFSILCVASHKSKYVEQELKERNSSAEKFFPKNYSFNPIKEFDTIENLGDGDSFYEFKLNKILN